MTAPRRPRPDLRWENCYSELAKLIRVCGSLRSVADPELLKWLKTQRALAVGGTLRAERWLRLRELGVELHGSCDRWERRFAQLRAYRERFGHTRVPNLWKEDVPFGNWVHVQRAFRKKGTLSAMRIALLDSIGFEWHGRWEDFGYDKHWDRMLEKLERYREQHGHTEVPATFREVPGLAKWVINQRIAHNRGELRAARKERLDAIGFVWKSTCRAQRELWERRFTQLLAFRERHGHCRVPNLWKEDVAFGKWVHVQRAFKGKGMLSAERIQRLEAIGFEWRSTHRLRYTQEEHWEQMLARLDQYRRETGHTEVPPSFPGVKGLGKWVVAQRIAAKNGTLRADRRERLEAIGFAWRGERKSDAERWERRFEQLLAFRERHGHCGVPRKWKEDAVLGYWVHNQRAFHKAGTLPAARLARLEAIGFAWSG